MFGIVRNAIELPALENVMRPGDGAAVTFLGIVRSRADDGRPVTGLAYEAFELMAIGEFQTIASEVRERFGDVTLAIVHRIGELRVGEVAVAVFAGGVHRGAAFDACEYALDEVKRRAPIWKKEHYADGAAQWRANPPGNAGE
jgi:molybdopterin synthase catalytic subunit